MAYTSHRQKEQKKYPELLDEVSECWQKEKNKKLNRLEKEYEQAIYNELKIKI